MRPPLQLVEVARSAAAANAAESEAFVERWEGERAPGDGYAEIVVAVLETLPRMLADNPALLAFDPRVSVGTDDAGRQALIDTILLMHYPQPVYGGECECSEDDKEDGRHVEVDDIGLTCWVSVTVCGSCCLDGEGAQTESCADGHLHGDSLPICATVSAIVRGGMCLCSGYGANPHCPVHGMFPDHAPHPVAVLNAALRSHWDPTKRVASIIDGFEAHGMGLVAPALPGGPSLVAAVTATVREHFRSDPVFLWRHLLDTGITCPAWPCQPA